MKIENDAQWVDIQDKLPKFSCITHVKTASGNQVKVYFHHDRAFPLARYWKNHVLSHWQKHEDGIWIYDVTHWRSLERN